MSLWVGIKHALNSTLGKSNFKPLDALINDVKDVVIGQKGLVASDDIYKVVADVGDSGIPNYKNLEMFRLNWGGSCKLSFTVSFKVTSSSNLRPLQYTVYKNGQVYRDITTEIDDRFSPNVNVVLNADAGDVFGLELREYHTNINPYLTGQAYVCASVVDLGGVDVVGG